MKPLFSGEYGLITTKRLVGGVGLSVMIFAADPEMVFSLGELDWQGKGHMTQHRDLVVKPVAYAITDVQVHSEGDRVTVAVAGDGPLYPEARLLDESRLIVDIPWAIPVIGKWVVPVGHPLLKRVRVGQHTDKVRLVLDVLDRPQFSVSQKGTDFVVTLRPRDAASLDQDQDNDPSGIAAGAGGDGSLAIQESKAGRRGNDIGAAADFPRSPERGATLSLDKGKFRVRTVQMTSDDAATEKGGRVGDVEVGTTRFVGRRISMDFQQAEITNILRLIAEVSGFNIVVGESVKGKVTMKLVGVPWDQALDMLLKMNGLGMIRQGTIVWIDTLANLSKQQDEEARSKEAKTKAEDLVNRLFYLRNVPAQEMMTALRPVLSPRGMIQFNQTTNALIVKDTGTKLQALEQLINGLDQEVPQVQIEARIVQADTVYARGMGIQWGIKDSQFTPTKFHLVGNVTGPFAAGSGTGSSASSTGITRDFLVNLPAQVGGLPAVPSIGWTFGRLADGFALDMRLSAGELLGLTKVIASPKITTMDRREAKISQGESIPFQTTSLQGTQTTFVDANLELNVTPTIISRDPNEPARRIQLRVRATRNAVGARSNPAGPSIDRREATTQVNVRDGETMVIGGVFVDVQGNNIQGVPYLSRFPVLGWLFKNKSESVSKQELLIFLTPTIVKT
ncbi:MAG: type IV pilus secretin PilQ [Nitrospira sp.]|nr:type IV pilus secretin PilQ [Nitrospira sp.]MCP9442509.1 type IV pilus secretin PilQ [Nitrospira sp.]